MPEAPRDPEAAWREAPLFTSGTRLRARVHDFGGPVPAFVSLHDTELEVDCISTHAEDGELRCLPSEYGDIRYLDANCTRAVVRDQVGNWMLDECDSPAPVFVTAHGSPDLTCSEGTTAQVYRLGAAREPAAVYIRGASGCMPYGMEDCLYEFEALPASSFVRAEVVTRPVDDGLALDFARYDDGAEVRLTARDTARDDVCGHDRSTGLGRCVPTGARAHWFEGVLTCDGAPLASYSTPCVEPVVVLGWQADSCGGYTHSLFEVVTFLPATGQMTDLGCEPRPSDEYVRWYEVGAPIDENSLPLLRELRLGAGRIALRYHASAGATPVDYTWYPFHDTALERDCYAAEMSNGGLRCVPAHIATSRVGPFADAECTMPIAQAPRLPEGCDEQPPDAVVVMAHREFGPLDRAHTRGAPALDLDTVHYLVDDVCTEAEPNPESVYYELGAELDLAVITERIE